MKLTLMQQYLILGIGALVGLVFLYYQFLLKPVNAKIVTLQSTLDQKKQDLEKAKQIVAKYAEFKKREDSVQRQLEWLQNRIPKTIDKTDLSEAIGLAQDKSGIVLTGFQFERPASGGAYLEIPANITLNSDFNGLLDFLYQVSISNLVMTVNDLSVNAMNSPASGPPLSISVRMTISGIQTK